ncbi:MAG: Mu transposase C-terminal domain-containing protein [Campylobacteraceae bacterium]|jgi:transposase InsO family protein|nr:Mu transposase C-terminal domain-containing protein [Campylobacteraceae bacterium]
MWLKTKEAAERLGKSERTIRIVIERALSAAKDSPYTYRYINTKGGRGGRTLEIWVNDEAAHVAQTHVIKQHTEPKKLSAKPIVRTNNFLKLTKSKQAEVLQRIELIKSYVRREKWVSYEQWSDGKILPTKSHFLRLVGLYKKGIKEQNVLELFCDKRGRPKGRLKMTTEMQEMAQRYILRRDIHPNDVGIYTLMKHAFKDALPSCDTVCRYLKRYREENKVLVAYAKDPDRARGKYRAAFGNTSEKARYKNHYWELDGTPADVITSDGKRWTIIGAIDIYSRRVVLTLEPTSSSYALARNLRAGILKLGVPENVVTDNGRDYKSNHFESVCQLLHINKEEVPPYSGWCKPHIERFFGTMMRELFRGLEGFCGHNVAERSAIQNSLSFEKKQEARKRWRSQKYTEKSFVRAMLDKNNTLGVFVPLTPKELRAYLDGWVENVYEQRKHSSIDTTPVQKYATDITPARSVEDEQTLDILLGEWEERTVGKDGIVIRRDGKEAQYTHTALIGHIGERVYVALGANMGEICVYDSEMAPICVATDASLEGISREAMRNISREMRKIESESLKLTQRADELARKLNDPTVKDIISTSAKTAMKLRKRTQAHKVEIETPDTQEVVMNGDRPLFTSDFDALVWAIENNREAEFADLISERAELYEVAKREVIYKEQAG